MADKFGVQVVKKSFRELAAQAKAIPDEEAKKAWAALKARSRVCASRRLRL